jgi:ATP-dependent helicase HrpA
MPADRARLAGRLRRLASASPPDEAGFARLAEAIRRSVEHRARRRASVPVPEFDGTLPIVAKRDAISAAIAKHQVVIVCGETGSGKTTQIPKLCLALGRGVDRMIGCTQPRRIAARSVATRLASELRVEVGTGVGYKVRFGDRVSDATLVKVMTDGILLAETHHDRRLEAYDTLVIDEAHERSLNVDFLLGYVKRLLPRRPDLKVVVTSATIDTARFAEYFDGAPVIEVSGRTYPVEIRYRPAAAPDADDDALSEDTLRARVLAAVDELCAISPRGDVLVFLPGEREIRECAEGLRKHHPPGTEILPLYSRLTAAEQDRVFKPTAARRIVLSTNVAETSLTVPGIRYVVDSGLARVKRYSARSKLNQLRVEAISRAAANQRAGRCGRVEAGVCIRLYAEGDYTGRPEYTTPEILRTSLAGVILSMSALELGDVADFPFIDPPAPRMIDDAYRLLSELGAVDDSRKLTRVGTELAKLPVDPKIGRILLAARDFGCLSEALVISAALSVPDVRDRPHDKRQAADEKLRRFHHPESDFLGLLNIWAFWQEAVRHKKSNRKLAEQLREHFLSPARLREWHEVHRQLHELMAEQGGRCNEVPAGYDPVHRALLAGLLGQIGNKDPESGEYLGPRQIRFHVAPASGVKGKPRWIVVGELAQTERTLARVVARVEPTWIEAAAGSLLRRTWLDPHWEKSRGQVVAFEQATLYGLVVVPRRPVHYGPIDPEGSRAQFIRAALVAGEFDTRAEFFAHNRKLIASVEALEHKGRRRDVLVDEETLFRFYDERLPADVHSAARFESWWRETARVEPRRLHMTRDDVMRHGATGVTEDLYPRQLAIRGGHYRLAYRFDPGHALDGVTVTLPVEAFNQVSERDFDWLVPGLLRDKVTALLRGLPQRLRRALVPLPEHVTRAMERLDPHGVPLLDQLAAHLARGYGIDVAPDLWPVLPDHLRMHFRVVDADGREMGSGRDFAALRETLARDIAEAFRAPASSAGIEVGGRTAWEFGELPESVDIRRAGRTLKAWPALVDEVGTVALRVFDSPEAAAQAHRGGVRRLFLLACPQQVRALQGDIRATRDIGLVYARLPAPPFADTDAAPAAAPGDAERHIVDFAADTAFAADTDAVRDQATFERLRDAGRGALIPSGTEAIDRVRAVLLETQSIRAELEARGASAAHGPAIAEMREQLDHLVYRGFLADVDMERLGHYPRYLKALRVRLAKLAQAWQRDRTHAAGFAPLWQNYRSARAVRRTAPLDEFRWFLEELRVSLFAQELKTPFPVSVKRGEKLWQALQAGPSR